MMISLSFKVVIFSYSTNLRSLAFELIWSLVDTYRLSLSGEKEVHEEVIQNVQDLAAVFLKYKDEVLVRMCWILQNMCSVTLTLFLFSMDC